MSEYKTNYNSNYRTRVDDLQKQMPSILDDYKKIYVEYNKSPENNQRSYDTIMGNITNVNVQLRKIQVEVDADITNFNNDMSEINKKISDNKNKNIEYKELLGDTTYKSNSADIMYNDYKELYESAYLKNWALFMGVIFSVALTIRTFKIK
jgi:hypothetical protein